MLLPCAPISELPSKMEDRGRNVHYVNRFAVDKHKNINRKKRKNCPYSSEATDISGQRYRDKCKLTIRQRN